MNSVHISKSKTRILDAAKQLHDEQGIDAVSMRNVADIVGVVPAAIYRHFRNKDELLDAMVEAGFALLETYLEGTNVKKLMLGFVRFALEQPRLYPLMFLRRRAKARRFPDDFRAGKSATFNILRSAVDGAMKRGEYRRDDSFETALTIWVHAHGLISMYTLGRFTGGDDEFLRYYDRSMRRILNGIRKGR